MTDEPRIAYRLSAPDPRSHYFTVRVRFEGELPDPFTVSLPAWTPGSYVIRDYSRHLIKLKAYSETRQDVPLRRVTKASWAIDIPKGDRILTVEYDVYAYDLTVRSSYLDRHYGLVTPASVFLYHDDWKPYPCTVQVEAPHSWDVATALPVDPASQAFHASDYDALVDSPIQMGPLVRYPFEVSGIPHELVVAGPGAEHLPRPRFLDDLSRIIETARTMFGSLPYHHYVFQVTLTDRGGGGLEHRDSANIMVSYTRWRMAKDYPKLLSLFAHEFFHAWNVKRLRPDILGPFDYQTEVYTSQLWALEGITDYFAQWLLAQSRVVDVSDVLNHWAESLKRLEAVPGRWMTALADASQEAWIRQYRPDSNTPNITVSYYLKGALVGLFLDLELRRHSHGSVTLPVVMRTLWERYRDAGYPEYALENLLVELGGSSIRDDLARYVHGTEPFDEQALELVGLTLDRQFDEPEGERPRWMGVAVDEREGRMYARQVERGGPAEAAGLSPGDEILGINGLRVTTAETWLDMLRQVDETPVGLTIAHRGQIQTLSVDPQPPRPDRYELHPVAHPSDGQKAAFHAWLGVPFPENVT